VQRRFAGGLADGIVFAQGLVDGIVFLGATGLPGVWQRARCDTVLSSPTGEAGLALFLNRITCVQMMDESMF
jgi:hypothetical protein